MRSFRMAALAAMALGLTGLASLTAPPVRADWALAFGQNGAKSWAFGSSVVAHDVEAARRRALAHCRDKGRNCRIVLVGADSCAALAVGVGDNAFAAEVRQTRIEAAHAALVGCLKSAQGDCEVKKTLCEP